MELQKIDTNKWGVPSEMSQEEIIDAGVLLARTLMTALNTTHSILQRNQIPLDTENPAQYLDGEEKTIVKQCAKDAKWAEDWITTFKHEAIERDFCTKLESAMQYVKR